MNPSLLQNLTENFLGKICTVITQSISLPVKDPIVAAQYFTGEVISIDYDGIWIKHMLSSTKAFYAFPLIGIVEEKVVASNDPLHEKITQDINKAEKKPTPKSATANNFVGIDELREKVKKAQSKNQDRPLANNLSTSAS